MTHLFWNISLTFLFCNLLPIQAGSHADGLCIGVRIMGNWRLDVELSGLKVLLRVMDCKYKKKWLIRKKEQFLLPSIGTANEEDKEMKQTR